MSAEARDPLEVDPQHYTVEFENERVRVIRLRYAPGEKSVMHSHPASVSVFLTDFYGQFTFPDGKTEEARAHAGQVFWDDPVAHLPENLSDKPFELIQIELKS
jgi:quercetin dioxygenase-like cupin family protein